MSASVTEENSPTISTSSKIGENDNVISGSTVFNIDPIIKKPVLGKDRAKKRLMAFAVKYNAVQKVDKSKAHIGKHKSELFFYSLKYILLIFFMYISKEYIYAKKMCHTEY